MAEEQQGRTRTRGEEVEARLLTQSPLRANKSSDKDKLMLLAVRAAQEGPISDRREGVEILLLLVGLETVFNPAQFCARTISC